jgi:hypothetical protein
MNERALARAKKVSTLALRERRQKVVRQVPNLQEILRGSLMERYLTCGKPGCKCTRGERHGPVWYLSVTLRAGKTVGMQVPKERVERIRSLVENHRKVKESLEAISEINWELVRRER